MNKILLNNISKIDSGKSFRQRIEDDPTGTCLAIQMKDISHEELSLIGRPHLIQLNEVNPAQLLQKGDILFVAKGNNNFAVMYDSDQPAVAVSLFFIIRPEREKINPEYLTWYLNSPNAQAYFHEMRLGGSVGNIRKESLEFMEIIVPPLFRQRQITDLNKLLWQEKKLNNDYMKKKEVFLNQTMINLSNLHA